MRTFSSVLLSAALFSLVPGMKNIAAPLPDGTPVRGWTLLSNSEPDDMTTLAATKDYQINHVELSHEIVHNLFEIKDDKRCTLVNRLTDAAHHAGVTEVVLWDHALYNLSYYPAEFKTGDKGTIDLDNPRFWDWLKDDYRKMLDRVPHADGIVLTFIETGARAENQSSKTLKTNQEKIAAVVDGVADVIINERHLNLYARTFAYTQAEYDNIIGAVKLFKNKKIRLLMKETPHDFFLTHPDDKYAGTIDVPTLMEFDTTGEFNGQGVIANTWPQYILGRWKDFAARPPIIGYTARTDRYGNTRLVGTPGEINLLALKRAAENTNTNPEDIYDDFIKQHYGEKALPEVKAAFKNAFDIVTCSLYTLGGNVASHSSMAYDPYTSSYILHVSGKWWDPPVAHLAHGINKDLHYWRDIMDHITPPSIKANPKNYNEVSWVQQAGWIHPGEGMTEEYLNYILTEKSYGVKLAEESLARIETAKPNLQLNQYTQLHNLFERTLLTAKLHHAVASAYYANRVWNRGNGFQTPEVDRIRKEGLAEIPQVAAQIERAPEAPRGQWNWKGDAAIARKIADQIKKDQPATLDAMP